MSYSILKIETACGCSSVVERQLPKLNVDGSSPFTRFLSCTVTDYLSIKKLSFSLKGLVSKTDEVTGISADLKSFGKEVYQI